MPNCFHFSDSNSNFEALFRRASNRQSLFFSFGCSSLKIKTEFKFKPLDFCFIHRTRKYASSGISEILAQNNFNYSIIEVKIEPLKC